MQYNKILVSLFCLIIFSKDIYAANTKYLETSASFTVTTSDIRKLDKNDPIIGALIVSTGETTQTFLEDNNNKTLVYFAIKYTAPALVKGETTVKPITITQYGIYDHLTPDIKSRLEAAMQSPITIKIGYDELDPNSIQFIFDGVAYPTPILVSDTIPLSK